MRLKLVSIAVLSLAVLLGSASPAFADPPPQVAAGTPANGGALRVARIEPRTMRTKPLAMPTVSGSLSSATPSASATAGLTYVMTVARAEPASAMSAKKSTKASAVQTIPSTATANTTAGEGRVGGSCAIPTGPYT